ncbi:MAG TPA: hypothetical protein VFC94_04795 [Bacteroidaceae bacterium]|nr:hypothetical protein [Bacteroidaceae bacterium]
MKRHFVLFFTLLFCCTVCFSTQSATQNLSQFARNLYDFEVLFPQEKVYVQLDNTGYYQGEIIWFKCYVVNAANLIKAPSKVVYVELISPSGVVVETQRLKVVHGQCDGSFSLVDKSTRQAREMRGALYYQSGYYEIRAYTLNMLNFDHNGLFSRVIPIYEKPKEDGDYYSEDPVIKMVKSDIENYRPESPIIKKLNVSFYPEGGNLVQGLNCRVAFKAVGENGLGVDVTGVLREDESVEFKTGHDGMGVFEFTPERKKYRAKIEFEGNQYTFDLPDAQTSGYTVKLTTAANEDVDVNISGSSDMMIDTLGLIITCRGQLVYFNTLPGQVDNASFTISMAGIPAGVCQLTLFTQKGEIMARRSFFNNQSINVPNLKVETDKSVYNPFEKININFSLVDGAGEPFADRFCVSVRDSRDAGTIYSEDLRIYMLLSSDLKGFIYKPEYYFESDEESVKRDLDMLLMIQGWERYDWKTMSGVNKFEEKHRIEKGLTFNGWVLTKRGSGVLSGIKVQAAVVPKDKKHVDQFKFVTDKNGYFGFDLTDFEGEASLTISLRKNRNNKLANAKILLERSIKPSLRAFSPEELIFPEREINKKFVDLTKMELEKIGDDGFPHIIDSQNGVLLQEVDILGKRKFIDFYTFKALDVIKDSEEYYDRGDFTSDVYGYLLSKGYPIWRDDSVQSSEEGELSQESQQSAIPEHISISDGDTYTRISNAMSGWYMGAYKLFWYVHDLENSRYQTIYEEPALIDMDMVKSIVVYDRPVAASSVFDLTPILESDFSHDAGESFNTFKSDFIENSGNYFVVDIQVKEDYELKTRKELFSLNRRVTTVQGYSTSYEFYNPSYPEGPVLGDVDYRRTLYWNPDVISDREGKAKVEFYNNMNATRIKVSACGITAGGTPYTLLKEM